MQTMKQASVEPTMLRSFMGNFFHERSSGQLPGSVQLMWPQVHAISPYKGVGA